MTFHGGSPRDETPRDETPSDEAPRDEAPSGDGPGPSGPLAGVRVLEMAGIGPAPFAAMMLADLGAEVVRIDRPDSRSLSLASPERDILGRGRRCLILDLKRAGAVDVLLGLVARADILLEGFRPGVAERLGWGPEVCRERNPALVFGRMTGWGQDGPLATTAGHDIDYLAVAGALDGIGRAGGPPVVPQNLLGDFGGGALYLVAGVMAALHHARETGEGQVVDAAITDGVAHLQAMTMTLRQAGAWPGGRGENLLDSGAPFYDVYATADGRWLAVGALEPQFWAELTERLGGDDLPDRDDPRQWPALRERLAAIVAEHDLAHWLEVFDGTDCCVAPVMPLDEAPDHPHHRARGTFVDRDGLRQPAPAPRFSLTPATLTVGPRPPGADTRAVLADWGIGDVDRLLAEGVVVETPAPRGGADLTDAAPTDATDPGAHHEA